MASLRKMEGEEFTEGMVEKTGMGCPRCCVYTAHGVVCSSSRTRVSDEEETFFKAQEEEQRIRRMHINPRASCNSAQTTTSRNRSGYVIPPAFQDEGSSSRASCNSVQTTTSRNRSTYIIPPAFHDEGSSSTSLSNAGSRIRSQHPEVGSGRVRVEKGPPRAFPE